MIASASPRDRLAWRDILCIHALMLGPALLMFAAGHVHPSARAHHALMPIWIALGLILFTWLMRQGTRRLRVRGSDLPTTRRLYLVLLCALLATISTVELALGLPAIPHRWTSIPVEVRTVVADKVIYRGKSTSYCVGTPPFDDRIAPMKWCTSSVIFGQAQVGEVIVLHGSSSWFGFLPDHFDLDPPTPAPTAPSPAIAHPEPLNVWPGDDLAKLQAAYPGSPAPSPFHSADPGNQQMLQLRDRGLWFFLAADGTIDVIRLDQPFSGAVDGVRLGDTLDDVRRARGADGRNIDHGSLLARSFVFETPAGHALRVDLAADGRVRTIFLIRPRTP